MSARRRREIPLGTDELQARGDRCGAWDLTTPWAQALSGMNSYSDEALLIYKNWRDEARESER